MQCDGVTCCSSTATRSLLEDFDDECRCGHKSWAIGRDLASWCFGENSIC